MATLTVLDGVTELASHVLLHTDIHKIPHILWLLLVTVDLSEVACASNFPGASSPACALT